MLAVVVASAVAGIATGLVDTLLTLAGVPDSANVTHRIGVLVGIVPFSVLVAVPVGVLVARVAPSRRGPTVAAAAVVALWAIGVAADVVANGVSAGTDVALLTLALGSIAAARLAADAGTAVARLDPRLARRLVGGGTVALVLGLGASVPGIVSPHLGGTGPCVGPTTPVPRGPNVVLITVDALRADAAHGMRSYRRLAARGHEFTQHVTAAPWTLPSMASLLTGVPPDEHGAGRSLVTRSLAARSPVAEGVPTLAGTLGAAGWRTHAVVTNPFLTRQYGIDRGFCTFDNVSMGGEYVRTVAQTTPFRWARLVAPRLLPSDRADRVRARAERWLAAEDGRPFFLWIHFLDPHAPYGDREGASTSIVLDLMALQRRTAMDEAPFHEIGLLRAGEYRPGAAERARIAELYREDVAYADAEIGRLLDTLDARGLAANTAIVFTADHGEEFWEHGGVEHGRTLYEEVLHVPMIVVPPGGAAPVRTDTLTTVLDVAPTIAALAGVRMEGEGADLLAAGPRPALRLPLGTLLFGEEWVGVRTPDEKYLRAAYGEERLYDLARDPGELVNRAGGSPETVATLRAALPTLPADPASGVASGTLVEALRAIGYVR
jgi:arylsulfatase